MRRGGPGSPDPRRHRRSPCARPMCSPSTRPTAVMTRPLVSSACYGELRLAGVDPAPRLPCGGPFRGCLACLDDLYWPRRSVIGSEVRGKRTARIEKIAIERVPSGPYLSGNIVERRAVERRGHEDEALTLGEPALDGSPESA